MYGWSPPPPWEGLLPVIVHVCMYVVHICWSFGVPVRLCCSTRVHCMLLWISFLLLLLRFFATVPNQTPWRKNMYVCMYVCMYAGNVCGHDTGVPVRTYTCWWNHSLLRMDVDPIDGAERTQHCQRPLNQHLLLVFATNCMQQASSEREHVRAREPRGT